MAPFIGSVVFCYDPPYHMLRLIPCFAAVATHSGSNAVKKLVTHFVLENFKLSYSLKSTDRLSLGQPLVWFILF